MEILLLPAKGTVVAIQGGLALVAAVLLGKHLVQRVRARRENKSEQN
jgi:hypothetical protein